MKHFKNIKSYDDLKNQYRGLLKANHPDNGGDLETMKEINVEYDALFRIWKDRQEKETRRKSRGNRRKHPPPVLHYVRLGGIPI